jgi:hypothetical protein
VKIFKKYIINYRWFNADCLIAESGFLIDKKTTVGKNMGYFLTALCRPGPEETLPHFHIDRLKRSTQHEA